MHSKQELLEALDLAEDARLDKLEIKAKYKGAKVFTDVLTDTQGFMYLKGRKVYIAFRGTQQLKDWFTDVNAFHMIFPYGNLDTKIMVHRGFMMAYLSVRNTIHKYLLSIKDKYDSIRVRGHSLGGALAVLCAVDLQYNNIKTDIDCVSSGNPMVGNKEFVTSYNKRVHNTTRLFMRRDIVPKLPPEWFEKEAYEGYSHAGYSLPIGPKDNPFLGILTWFKKNFKKDSLLDDLFNHDIDLYRTETLKLNLY